MLRTELDVLLKHGMAGPRVQADHLGPGDLTVGVTPHEQQDRQFRRLMERDRVAFDRRGSGPERFARGAIHRPDGPGEGRCQILAGRRDLRRGGLLQVARLVRSGDHEVTAGHRDDVQVFETRRHLRQSRDEDTATTAFERRQRAVGREHEQPLRAVHHRAGPTGKLAEPLALEAHRIDRLDPHRLAGLAREASLGLHDRDDAATARRDPLPPVRHGAGSHEAAIDHRDHRRTVAVRRACAREVVVAHQLRDRVSEMPLPEHATVDVVEEHE